MPNINLIYPILTYPKIQKCEYHARSIADILQRSRYYSCCDAQG